MLRSGILPVQKIAEFIRRGAIRSRRPILRTQLQPASLDLRLGEEAYRVRTGFLPEETEVESRLRESVLYEFDLRKGGILEKGQIYLIPLQEELRLPRSVQGRSNPKSSTGRLDIFTRVVTDRNPRFDDVPAGYRGPLYLEIAPRSFPVRVRTGQALNQIRFFRGRASLTDGELRALYRRTPLLWHDRRAVPLSRVRTDGEGGIFLRIRLRAKGPVGYRAKAFSGIIDVGDAGTHRPEDFWEPVRAPNGRLIIEPEEFYIFASRERIVVPPDHAAEMLAYDVGIGELRTNYAGFFDNGFGWGKRPPGTRAVLEVRAHDVPFQIEDGQVFFRLSYFRTMGVPEFLYGDPKAGSSYQEQDLTLAKQFQSREPWHRSSEATT